MPESVCSVDSDDSEATALAEKTSSIANLNDVDDVNTTNEEDTNNAEEEEDEEEEEQRFQISSFGKKSPLRSMTRKTPSDLYIFHSTEINREILKMLLKAMENFLDEFRRTIRQPSFTDHDLITVCGDEFIPKLKDFITGDENNAERFYDRMCSYEIGAYQSEPMLYEVEKFRQANRKQKLKTSQSTSRIDGHTLEATLGIKNKKHEQLVSGSLPAKSFFDSYSKELKLREKVLLKSIRSKSIKTPREESLLFSHAATNKSVKEKNKCIVSTATSTKKMVRFADAFGLDLEKVKIITNNSFVDAFSYAQECENDDNYELNVKAASKPFLVLIPLFALRKSLDAVLKLDDFIFDYENKLIKCVVKAKNLSYHKRIFARVTFNNWKKHTDLEAIYVKSDNLTLQQKTAPLNAPVYSNDYFAFCVIIPEKNSAVFNENQKPSAIEECTLRIEFALCYEESGRSHWDNNNGENYKFQCFYNMN